MAVEIPKRDEGTTRIHLDGGFIRDQYTRLVILFVLIAGLVAGLVIWGLQEISFHSKKYEFQQYDGKLFPTLPLDQPGITTADMLQWAVEAVNTAYSFNFVDYRKVLLDVRGYFTKTGYQHYLKALTDSNTIQAVTTNKFVVSVTPTSAPIILREKPTPEGYYAWQISLPVDVNFQSSIKESMQHLVLTMTIVRVPFSESPDGIAIASFMATEGKG